MHARKLVQTAVLTLTAMWAGATPAAGTPGKFHLEETSIEQLHAALRAGDTTCTQVVQAYVARAKAYNGFCTQPVTADGKPIAQAYGPQRGGTVVKFPTQTKAINKLVPDFDRYKGKALDYGHMQPTLSDPSVQQQFGIVAGIPNAGGINGLDTLNIRGERSVTCKGKFDAHPSTGPLPADAPAPCEAFRKLPDALERAAELDKLFGKNIDTASMPLYCVPMSFKAVYDAKDMRSTGGADAKYAMDAAPEDSTLVARMRKAGAIIYAHALNSEYNGGSGDPGGDAKPKLASIGTGGARETWGGTTCNPYDTERETGGSSGGSGTSVAANLVMCSICETTGGSCRNPGTHNGVVNIVPTKGIISYGGGIGANPYQDRPGINCKSVADAAVVLDAFRDPKTGFFDARDPYTALPRVIASKTPYTAALTPAGKSKPLAGMRIGVVRELMVKHAPSDGPIIDGINRELKVLQALGAELVETVDPQYPDDPSIPNVTFGFQDAMAEVLPFHMPEVLSWKKADGTPEFAVPGHDVASRAYLVAASAHQAPWPANLNLRRIMGNPPEADGSVSGYTFAFQMEQYLALRGDATIKDWKTLNQNAQYFTAAKTAAMTNWGNKAMDSRTYDTTYTMKRRDSMRMVMMKVLEQNKIDVFVNPPLSTLPAKIGGAAEPNRDLRAGFGYGARLGIPEAHVPAGFADTIYEPSFVLSKDGTQYETVAGTKPVKLKSPLPYNIAFWAGPGEEATLLKVASAYEAATHHRKPPPAFPPVAGEP